MIIMQTMNLMMRLNPEQRNSDQPTSKRRHTLINQSPAMTVHLRELFIALFCHPKPSHGKTCHRRITGGVMFDITSES